MGSRSFIICCVYFPFVTSSHDYKVELSHCTGFINSIASAYYLSQIIVIGDMNFSCHTQITHTELETFKEGLAARSLLNESFCTDLVGQFSYVMASLGNSSFIDNVYVSDSLKVDIGSLRLIDSGSNLSYHKPLSLILIPPTVPCATVDNNQPIQLYNVRWDKCDLNNYYNASRTV